MIGYVVEQTLNGIQYGFVLFLIASGLTIILGILDVLNLAHGELFALGAYVAASVMGATAGFLGTPNDPISMTAFVGIVLLSAVVSAAVLIPVGAVLESVFLRPIYDRAEEFQLVLTFALLLIVLDVKRLVWGPLPLRAGGVFNGINQVPTTELLGFSYTSYYVFVIAVGAIVVASLFWFFNHTRTGRIIRATAINREMATAIGVSTDRTFTLVFAMGTFFAGFAGAIYVPSTSATLGMGIKPLVLSFVVIVIGGLGSLKGAFVGAMLVGVVSRWMIPIYPPAEIAAPFAIMAAVLLLKPEGLFGTWGETA